MTIRLQRKRPEEALTYTHDWTPFLGTDTIVSQTTTASGVTVSNVSILAGNRSISFKLTAGTLGTVGTVTQTVTTAAGLIETETFTIRIDADEPISLAEAKAHLRLSEDDTSQDALIESYIAAARTWVENYTGLAMIQRSFTERLSPTYGAIRLSRGPLVAVDSTAYVDAEGVDQTYAPRFWPGEGTIVPATNESWPTLASGEAFEITYTAGFAEGEQPQSLIQAMLLLIGHWYNAREGVSIGVTAVELPLAVQALCNLHRAMVA